jgi:hypothetical protein
MAWVDMEATSQSDLLSTLTAIRILSPLGEIRRKARHEST